MKILEHIKAVDTGQKRRVDPDSLISLDMISEDYIGLPLPYLRVYSIRAVLGADIAISSDRNGEVVEAIRQVKAVLARELYGDIEQRLARISYELYRDKRYKHDALEALIREIRDAY